MRAHIARYKISDNLNIEMDQALLDECCQRWGKSKTSLRCSITFGEKSVYLGPAQKGGIRPVWKDTSSRYNFSFARGPNPGIRNIDHFGLTPTMAVFETGVTTLLAISIPDCPEPIKDTGRRGRRRRPRAKPAMASAATKFPAKLLVADQEFELGLTMGEALSVVERYRR